jgi:hypothetical protein
MDWFAEIARVCAERDVLLDCNDPVLPAQARYQAERDRREAMSPVEHTPTCNLYPGYSQDPKTWARGCDCGGTERAARGMGKT